MSPICSFTLVFSLILTSCYAQPQDDLVTSLPGLAWNINYKMYSGYLHLANGHHLHYFFTESQHNPTTDPILLWLNGGPGCSSLMGLLYELGPFHVNNTDGSLYENIYSWNTNASVIYLESPICVGYSYADNITHCIANDTTTADDNYNALLVFYKKFPIYMNNKLFIMGESYGGVYVPTLAYKILLEDSDNIAKLSGFAVGDPSGFGDLYINGFVWYNYFHGWFSQRMFDNLQKECCSEPYTIKSCNFTYPRNSKCAELVADVIYPIFDGGINVYDWSIDCERNIKSYCNSDTEYERYLKNLYRKTVRNNNYVSKYIETEDDINIKCINCYGSYLYMNREDVRKAMHVDNNNISWYICSNTLQYDDTNFVHNMTNLYISMLDMKKDLYIMVYNGDTDPGINIMTSQWFVDGLNRQLIEKYREWFYDDITGYQVGGWIEKYDRISFVSVRNSGHMVPQFAPKASLKLFNAFIYNITF